MRLIFYADMDDYSKVAEGDVCWTLYADILVAQAIEGREPGLLRYVVKTLGLGTRTSWLDATLKQMEEIALFGAHHESVRVHMSRSVQRSRGRELEDVLEKCRCAACDAVSATKACTGCRKVRLHSIECSKMYWKAGHKKECRKYQRRAAVETSLEVATLNKIETE